MNKFTSISGIDYAEHRPVNIRFVPPDNLLHLWEKDYQKMRGSMIYGQSLNFNELINQLSEFQRKINTMNQR
jgi:hypothetical protein